MKGEFHHSFGFPLDVESGIGGGNGLQLWTARRGFAGAKTLLASNSIYETVI